MKVLAHGAKDAPTAREFNLAGLRRAIDLSIFSTPDGYEGIRKELDELSRYGMTGIYTLRIADPDDEDGRVDDPTKYTAKTIDGWIEMLVQAVAVAAAGEGDLEGPVPLIIGCCNEPAGGPGQIRSPEALEAWCEISQRIFGRLLEIQKAHPGMLAFASAAYATWTPAFKLQQKELMKPRDIWRAFVQTELLRAVASFVKYADVHLHTAISMELAEELRMMKHVWAGGVPISTEFGIAKHNPDAARLNVVDQNVLYATAWRSGFEYVCAAPFHPHGSNEIFAWSHACERQKRGGFHIRNQPWGDQLERLATEYNAEDDATEPGAAPAPK